MKVYLFDTLEAHDNLLPLSFTRPIADFRCGILTIREKWQVFLKRECNFLPLDYLKNKFGCVSEPDQPALFIQGNLLPNFELAESVKKLKPGQALSHDNHNVAFVCSFNQINNIQFQVSPLHENSIFLNFVFDIFLNNGNQIKLDFQLLTEGKKSLPLPGCVRTLSNDTNDIFIEEGAVVECASINVAEGPVYIGKDAVLMEGACIRGPFALCEGAEVRMGAKIYEGTTIGPHCKVGGEVSNTVFFGFSNKAHDGYLGNAVIGEWCNIGAGANASNLKNDYSLIRVWNYKTHSFIRTNLQFCGLIMGDHSKIGVNCMINTATVIGVGVNLYGCGFPRTFLSNFCEGSPSSGFSHTSLKKFLDTAQRVMSRRNLKLSKQDTDLLTLVYDDSTPCQPQ